MSQFVDKDRNKEHNGHQKDAYSRVDITPSDSRAEENGKDKKCRVYATGKAEEVEVQVVRCFSRFRQKHDLPQTMLKPMVTAETPASFAALLSSESQFSGN